MKSNIKICILFFFLNMLLQSCSNSDRLYEIFALEENDFPKMKIIVPNRAMKSPCTKEKFIKIKENLEAIGFNRWGSYSGMLGTDGFEIIKLHNYSLEYSFKYKNDKRIEFKPFYCPVVVYDELNSLIYFVLASDFGA